MPARKSVMLSRRSSIESDESSNSLENNNIIETETKGFYLYYLFITLLFYWLF